MLCSATATPTPTKYGVTHPPLSAQTPVAIIATAISARLPVKIARGDVDSELGIVTPYPVQERRRTLRPRG
jgi:hypothetical protein